MEPIELLLIFVLPAVLILGGTAVVSRTMWSSHAPRD